MSHRALSDLIADELFLAGERVPSGIYREIGTGREIELASEDVLPASLDGRIAAYTCIRFTWKQIQARTMSPPTLQPSAQPVSVAALTFATLLLKVISRFSNGKDVRRWREYPLLSGRKTSMVNSAHQAAPIGTRERFRIDFALIVLTGNITRYRIMRPLVECDRTVKARWYPIRTWFAEDPLRFLPGALRLRLRHLLDTWRLFLPSRADATVIHAFETYYLYTLVQRLMGRRVVIINNPDGPLPFSRRTGLLGNWKYQYAVRHTDLFVFWSQWALEEAKRRYPHLPENRLVVLHPGIDLSNWPMRQPHVPAERFKILFVGGDLRRKGADTLLAAFEAHLSDTCELHIATQSSWLAPEMRTRIESLPRTHLYLDLPSGSTELKALFVECDGFVLPTNGDTSSWVAIEALATGIPVIISAQGGIPEIVRNGETGLLIPPKDPQAIADAIDRLRHDSDLRERLIRQGRSHVEAEFDAVDNTETLLNLIKKCINERQKTR